MSDMTFLNPVVLMPAIQNSITSSWQVELAVMVCFLDVKDIAAENSLGTPGDTLNCDS